MVQNSWTLPVDVASWNPMIYGKGLKMSIHSGWEWVVGISELNQDHQQYPPPQNLPRPPNLRLCFSPRCTEQLCQPKVQCATLLTRGPTILRCFSVFFRWPIFFLERNFTTHFLLYQQKTRCFFPFFLDFRREWFIYIYFFNKYIIM